MAVVGLLPEYAQARGSVRVPELLGVPTTRCPGFEASDRHVFQDYDVCAHPVYTVGDQIAEAIESAPASC